MAMTQTHKMGLFLLDFAGVGLIASRRSKPSLMAGLIKDHHSQREAAFGRLFVLTSHPVLRVS